MNLVSDVEVSSLLKKMVAPERVHDGGSRCLGVGGGQRIVVGTAFDNQMHSAKKAISGDHGIKYPAGGLENDLSLIRRDTSGGYFPLQRNLCRIGPGNGAYLHVPITITANNLAASKAFTRLAGLRKMIGGRQGHGDKRSISKPSNPRILTVLRSTRIHADSASGKSAAIRG